jgi:glucosylceramidase
MGNKSLLLYLMSVGFLVFFTNKANCQPIEWVSTTQNKPWGQQPKLKFSKAVKKLDFVINSKNTQQTITGFGACFNELGWSSLNSLNPIDRDLVLLEFFAPGVGGNFNICRMPLGANDFSLDWYSYNETAGDLEMKNFSIDNDKETLIPFIKAAKKFNPGLKLWASPWCPPSWMKYNQHYACAVPWDGLAEKFQNQLPADKQGKEGTNMFIQEEAYFKSYALYFSRFIQAYRDNGIDVSMVMPQNEFNSCQMFPSCTWTASGLAKFIGYLGPQMKQLGVDVMLGTMERPNVALVDTILMDPIASKYIKGIGFQWAGKDALPAVNQKYKGFALYQTEQECGDGKNDWKHCLHAWGLMKHYLKNGVDTYLYWNMSLDKGGYSRWGWQQNSLVTIDRDNKTYQFNLEYYLLKHVSHFVKPGAKLISTDADILAFKNPDKSIVIVLYNDADAVKEIAFGIDKKKVVASLEAHSFNTLLIKK